MGESREVRPRPSSQTVGASAVMLRIRPWVLYLLLAVIWPLAVEALVALEILLIALGHTLGASSELLEAICALLAVLAATATGRWAGRALARVGAPSRLFIVPVLWAAVATASGVFGLGAADVRQVFGLVGVVGVFVFGALGFWLGIRKAWSAEEDVGAQTRI